VRICSAHKHQPPTSTGCRYVKRECSGRTDLDPGIAKTLNDEWVSFPTWSEESSFLASKKNVFEEAIFRCEDERFELDIIIEANLATIRCLDMVVKSLEEMSEQEQRAFKFPIMTLGGNSEFIHRAAVTRLYGDRAPDVFAAMDRDPLNAIPLVLKRLKQKNVEWRMTQRQWNQIWRELHEKNYLRSLDYQGPSFKRTDPLIFKPKALREKMIETRDQ
jgi:paired amphipathic helix protein Sin3a